MSGHGLTLFANLFLHAFSKSSFVYQNILYVFSGLSLINSSTAYVYLTPLLIISSIFYIHFQNLWWQFPALLMSIHGNFNINFFSYFRNLLWIITGHPISISGTSDIDFKRRKRSSFSSIHYFSFPIMRPYHLTYYNKLEHLMLHSNLIKVILTFDSSTRLQNVDYEFPISTIFFG